MPKRKKTILKEPHFTLGFSEDDKHEPIPLSTSLVVGGTAQDLRKAYMQWLDDGFHAGVVDFDNDIHGRWTEMLENKFKLDTHEAHAIYNDWMKMVVERERSALSDQQVKKLSISDR